MSWRRGRCDKERRTTYMLFLRLLLVGDRLDSLLSDSVWPFFCLNDICLYQPNPTAYWWPCLRDMLWKCSWSFCAYLEFCQTKSRAGCWTATEIGLASDHKHSSTYRPGLVISVKSLLVFSCTKEAPGLLHRHIRCTYTHIYILPVCLKTPTYAQTELTLVYRTDCERTLPPSFKGSSDLQEMPHSLQHVVHPQNSDVILMILGGKVMARKIKFYVIIKNSEGSPGPSLILQALWYSLWHARL